MSYMSLEINFFRKKKYYIFFYIFFLFVKLLPSFINEQSHITLLVFDDGAVEHILGYGFTDKVWLYGFQSIFWQVLIDFLFVVYLLFFL